ncbi:expressed protein [Echinococcus multilocularis]|uniref:Expressed protein n=1 Tax=Echinococcus multilocularis TaxID=6211 RepID=A0A068YHJ9_ECHMU|nr:expressed protein [Echinococcus multilocularis]
MLTHLSNGKFRKCWANLKQSLFLKINSKLTHTNKKGKRETGQDSTITKNATFINSKVTQKKMNEVRGGQSGPGEEEENTQMWLR